MTKKLNPLMGSIIILLLICSHAWGTPPDNCMLFSITSQNTARLGVINTSRRSVELTITNTAGEVFFTKSVRGEDNYFQMFDLSNLPDGNYSVNLSDGANTTNKRFTVTNSLAKIIKVNEDPKPNFIMPDDQTLIVSYFNVYSNDVNIFFMLDDEVVFEDRGLTGITLSKKYSLRQLPAGKYTVKLYSGGQIYSYPLALN